VELIKFLHVHGADITTADKYGATPLHYASQMRVQQQQQQQQQQQREDKDEDEDEDAEVTAASREDQVVDGAARLNVQRAVLMRTEIVDCLDVQLRTPLIWAASCGILLSIYVTSAEEVVFYLLMSCFVSVRRLLTSFGCI